MSVRDLPVYFCIRAESKLLQCPGCWINITQCELVCLLDCLHFLKIRENGIGCACAKFIVDCQHDTNKSEHAVHILSTRRHCVNHHLSCRGQPFLKYGHCTCRHHCYHHLQCIFARVACGSCLVAVCSSRSPLINTMPSFPFPGFRPLRIFSGNLGILKGSRVHGSVCTQHVVSTPALRQPLLLTKCMHLHSRSCLRFVSLSLFRCLSLSLPVFELQNGD